MLKGEKMLHSQFTRTQMQEFANTLSARMREENHECQLYGRDVVDSFREYARAREFLKARRPGLLETKPDIFQKILLWTLDMQDGGKAAREFYAG